MDAKTAFLQGKRQSDPLLRMVAIIAVAGALAGFSNLGFSYLLLRKVVGIESRVERDAREREERRALFEKWQHEMQAAGQIRDEEIKKLRALLQERVK